MTLLNIQLADQIVTTHAIDDTLPPYWACSAPEGGRPVVVGLGYCLEEAIANLYVEMTLALVDRGGRRIWQS